MKTAVKEKVLISTTILVFFLLFVHSWLADSGAWVFGLYSEVDGQFFAWTAKYLLLWGSPFDMNTINPFGGLVSVFTPVNPWWNPASYPLGLPTTKLTNFVLSYSIYWLEIFFAIYFLGKTVGLNKIESIIAAEVFVLLVFPPFSAYYNSTSLYSLAPVFAHILALMCLLTMVYAKLGAGGKKQNIFLVFLFMATSLLILMGGSFGFIPCVPVYGLLLLGFTFHNFNQRQFLWRMAAVLLAALLFFGVDGYLYYKNTVGYVEPSLDFHQAISFAIPHSLQKHRSIFYGARPLFSYLHVFALLGGLVGLFCQRGKYRWLAVSFVLIIIMPDLMGFVIENKIMSGSISDIGIDYYVWDAYPVYCICFAIFLSFLWHQFVCLGNFLTARFPINLVKDRLSQKARFSPAFIAYLKLLLPIMIIPLWTMHLWFGSLAKNAMSLKEPKKTPIVAYLEKQLALAPGANFRGTATSYFSSKNSPLRQLNGPSYEENMAQAAHFTENDYILSREFLNKRFENRHMFSDLWNFNIPTLEEYGHWVTASMYVYFKNMLAEEGDRLNGNFLNVYKLDLNVLRALGAHFVIADKVLNDKGLSLIMMQNQSFPIPMERTLYLSYEASMAVKKMFDGLMKTEFKSGPVAGPLFMREFNKNLALLQLSRLQDKAKIAKFLANAVKSTVGKDRLRATWSHEDLERIRSLFNSIIFTWAVSPPLYLYEIKNPNLANFSPTQVIQINSVDELFFKMKNPHFSFENMIIVQDDLPRNIRDHLVKAKNTELIFEPNAVRVKAESAGWSILLLPLQYTHCYRLRELTQPSKGQKSARLLRANLIQGALLFNGKTEVKLDFAFGIGKSATCRGEDTQDMAALGGLKA